MVSKSSNTEGLIQRTNDVEAVKWFPCPVRLLRLVHEAEVPSPGIGHTSVTASTRHSGCKVLTREGVANFILEAVVTNAIVGTAHPDLHKVGGRKRRGGGERGGKEEKEEGRTREREGRRREREGRERGREGEREGGREEESITKCRYAGRASSHTSNIYI